MPCSRASRDEGELAPVGAREGASGFKFAGAAAGRGPGGGAGDVTVRWTDSHCHLDDDGLPGGTDAALAAARAAGVAAFVCVGTDAARSAAAIAIATAHPDVWATVGLHPHDARYGVA